MLVIGVPVYDGVNDESLATMVLILRGRLHRRTEEIMQYVEKIKQII